MGVSLYQNAGPQAIEAVDADLARQTTLNTDVRTKFDAMDITERMQCMQAFLQKDPQQAMKVMRALAVLPLSDGQFRLVCNEGSTGSRDVRAAACSSRAGPGCLSQSVR